MKDLIESIARALVDYPEQVQVRVIEIQQVSVFELRVNASDVGYVIGRKGRIAHAIRTILTAVGAKQRRQFTLEILASD